VTAQAANHDTEPNVFFIWRHQIADWIEDHNDEPPVRANWDCVLCGEETDDGEGPAALIYLEHFRTFLAVCTHCADPDHDDGKDVLDRCEVVVCGNSRGSTH
jgi:hypothetical protein